MRVAIGLKAHSGWAAAVAIGSANGELSLIERCRLELVEEKDRNWAKQPYHAAETLESKTAARLVSDGIRSAKKIAVRELRWLASLLTGAGHQIAACAVLTPSPMPDWTVEEILAVHPRMHKAEGVMFPQALAKAATECGFHAVEIPEKQLDEISARAFGKRFAWTTETLIHIGKTAGPPWTKDQKTAALAAAIALTGDT